MTGIRFNEDIGSIAVVKGHITGVSYDGNSFISGYIGQSDITGTSLRYQVAALDIRQMDIAGGNRQGNGISRQRLQADIAGAGTDFYQLRSGCVVFYITGAGGDLNTMEAEIRGDMDVAGIFRDQEVLVLGVGQIYRDLRRTSADADVIGPMKIITLGNGKGAVRNGDLMAHGLAFLANNRAFAAVYEENIGGICQN